MGLDLEKLKQLAKDETAFEELVKLFDVHKNSSPHTDLILRDFFIVERYRKAGSNPVISDSVKDILQYSANEISEMPGGIFSLIHEDDINLVKRNTGEFETDPTKNSMQQVYRLLCKDGKSKWVKETISVERDEHGRITKQVSILCDVTSIKDSEEKFREENVNLREINKAKDKFISIVSHDLRSPFTSLLGFSEILLNENELPEEEKREYLNYIHDASQTQLQMINYLLEWSRLQTGRIQMEVKRLNLRVLVSTCVSSLIGNAIRKDIKIHHDIDNEIFVEADEKLMSQAITNLISNAIKFTPRKKSIAIKANKFKTGLIEVVVKDQGKGMSEKDQEKLFRIDQKFSMEGTEGEKGSGLGLTLVKEIVDRHKGDVWFYSEEEQGTEFHLTIPEAKNVILIVEDDEALVELYSKSIEKAAPGFQVRTSKNGYEAMSSIMKTLPTAVLTDHDMPLMNGYQLVEAIRKRDKNFSIPIIVISAKLNDVLVEKYERLGVSIILHKPVDPDALVETLKETII